MLSRAGQNLLGRQLRYAHPQRLPLPPELDAPGLREVVDGLLRRNLGLACVADASPFDVRWQTFWLTHWVYLPHAASLMGAYLQLAELARGAALRELDSVQRAFAGCDLGARARVSWPAGLPWPQRTSALGLRVLQGWHGRVSAGLLEQLSLQFSPDVVELAATLPAQPTRAPLFRLAVQHARRSPNLA